MNRTGYILVIAFLILCSKVFATHIVGGEIYYTQLNSNGDYELVMKHYRDCYNGSSQALNMDLTSYVFIYNSDDGSLYAKLTLTDPILTVLNAPLINPCLIAPGNVCVEEAVFTTNINLPLNANGYDIVYQRCCRNGTIININLPGDVGSTIFAHVPGSNQFTTNSSPRYTNFPPIFICTNDPLRFDNSATDPDGDIIRYELCDAFLGASSDCPKPGTGTGNSGPCVGSDDEPGSPPYTSVPYSNGFSGGNPITGNPSFAIDSITGLLTGTATQSGQYVVAVCAKEYKNGVLISINRREFQFNVVNCGFPIAAFPVQVEKCSGMDFTFSQTSFNATNFAWNFGDGSTTTGGSVNHTYTDTGVYTVTLIATNNNPGCADTVEQMVYAYPKLVPNFSVPTAMCLDNNSYSFAAGGIYDNTATFSWNFGFNANPILSNAEQPGGISFLTPGQQLVSLSVSQYGCTKTVNQTVNVLPEPRPLIIPSDDQCSGDTVQVDISYGGSGISSVSIDPGYPGSSYAVASGTTYNFVYPDTGLFSITLIAATSSGCVDTVSQQVKVYPKFKPQFLVPNEQCLQGNSFGFIAEGIITSAATFSWYFDASANQSVASGINVNGISYTTDGFHNVVLQGFQYACIETDTQQLYVIPEPVAQIEVQDQFCEGLTYNFTNASQISNSWFWNFGVTSVFNDTTSLKNPSYTFPDTGTYNVMLVSVNQGKCYDTTFRAISIKPLVKPFFPPPGGQCLDENNFNFNGSGNDGSTAIFGWSFPQNANIDTATVQNVSNLVFSASGTYPVTFYIEEYGCLKSYTDTAIVNEPPIAAFHIPNAEGCKPVTVAFKDSSSSATSYTYFWNFGDGSTSTDANPIHTYNEAGIFDVRLIIQNTEGCTRKDTFSVKDAVTVLGLPQAGLNLDSVERSVFEPFIKFTDVSTDAQTCFIAFGDGDTSNSCNILHTYPDTGWYEYTQVVTNEYGCSDTITGKVYIRPDFAFYVPNAFTPNGDDFNNIFKPSIFGVLEYEFSVFDRWGLEIFKTNDTKAGWDGKYKGKPSPQDVYVYKIKYVNVFRKEASVTGVFTLVK